MSGQGRGEERQMSHVKEDLFLLICEEPGRETRLRVRPERERRRY